MDNPMKFNPSTKKLFTNEGVFIKKLHCPIGVKWAELGKSKTRQRHCDFCEKNITDIQGLDQNAVINILNKDKNACLKLDLNDLNIRVINHNA